MSTTDLAQEPTLTAASAGDDATVAAAAAAAATAAAVTAADRGAASAAVAGEDAAAVMAADRGAAGAAGEDAAARRAPDGARAPERRPADADDGDGRPAGAARTLPAVDQAAIRTFSGRTLEEVLPKIREELGPDAIVVRQREGLRGGVGGFFQQRFVEVDAVPAQALRPRIDVYDEPPATPESFAALLAEAEDADPIVSAAAFVPPVAPRALPQRSAAEAPAPGDAEPALGRDEIADRLVAGGLSAAFAERLVADAEAHELPFADGDLRAAVRRALARRLPAPLPLRAGALAVAFAGPGAGACAEALVAAYAAAGRRARLCATPEQARGQVERGAPDTVVALDLSTAGDDAATVAELAGRLAEVELDEVLVVARAGVDVDALRALRDGLAPLHPTGLALDRGDGLAPLGAALELACATRLPLRYVLRHDGPGGARIAPAEPEALAEVVLP